MVIKLSMEYLWEINYENGNVIMGMISFNGIMENQLHLWEINMNGNMGMILRVSTNGGTPSSLDGLCQGKSHL